MLTPAGASASARSLAWAPEPRSGQASGRNAVAHAKKRLIAGTPAMLPPRSRPDRGVVTAGTA
jgi:hypothetical protein